MGLMKIQAKKRPPKRPCEVLCVVNCWCVSSDRFNAGDSLAALVQGLRDHSHHDLHLQKDQER